MTQFDIVFEGGGAKGVALAGGMKALLERGHQYRRLVGTSAGAITATNLAVGYTPEEIRDGSLRKTPDGQSIYTTFSDAPPVLTDEELLDTGLGRMLPQHRVQEYLAQCPAGRLGRVEEVAEMAAFLISEENTFMTGAKVVVDGGL